jgi:hypothetical protein
MRINSLLYFVARTEALVVHVVDELFDFFWEDGAVLEFELNFAIRFVFVLRGERYLSLVYL